jgi:hypothetical protein
MRDITELERIEAQAMTDAYAKQLKTRKTETQTDFDFDDFNKKAKAETAIFTIKRLVARSGSGVQASIKKYLLQRNSVIKRNKERKAEADKLHKNGWQST